MVNKTTLVVLRSQLPRGAAGEIRDRLLKKGHIFTISYINMVLNPDDEKKNELIINEAILLRDEYQLHIAELENRILHPSN